MLFSPIFRQLSVHGCFQDRLTVAFQSRFRLQEFSLPASSLVKSSSILATMRFCSGSGALGGSEHQNLIELLLVSQYPTAPMVIAKTI